MKNEDTKTTEESTVQAESDSVQKVVILGQITTSCPECGNYEYWTDGAMDPTHRGCTKCGQEWFTDINYKSSA
jgi:DNA-directed RNA polymerase subunit M/transcription elongation factor TFIIS